MAIFTKRDIQAMVDRMAQAYGVDKNALPAIFGAKQSTIANWTHFLRVPNEQLRNCCKQTGASMDWLMFAKVPTAMLKRDTAIEIEQAIKRVVGDAVDYKAITEHQTHGAAKMTEKLIAAVLQCLTVEEPTTNAHHKKINGA